MAMSALMAAARSGPDAAYEKFKEVYSQPIEDAETAIATALRLQHPSLKLVTCPAGVHDLIGFAQAGHGKLTIIDPQSFHAIRTVKTVGANAQRIAYKARAYGEEEGDVTDTAADEAFSISVKFGKYHYEWENQEYLVYLVYSVSPGGSDDLFHILCEASPDDGNPLVSRAIDRLMHAAASWAMTLRQEILVFNSGRWIKDPDLFESVQSTSWDDVILEDSIKSSIARDVHGFFDAKDMYKDLDVPWKVNGRMSDPRSSRLIFLTTTLERHNSPR